MEGPKILNPGTPPGEDIVEVALVFGPRGKAIYWHEPPKRSATSLPDSRTLWGVLWDYRDELGGVAHTHPWMGPASPSGTDLTTFAAIELGLGKRLLWPIVTLSEVRYFAYQEESQKYDEVPIDFKYETYEDGGSWLKNIGKIRRLSVGNRKGE